MAQESDNFLEKDSSKLGAVSALPLIVDLDGTLSRSDTLVDCLFYGLRRSPLRILRTLFSSLLLRPQRLKLALLQDSGWAPELVPINQGVMSFIQIEKQAGRSVYLATGATQKVADDLLARLSVFNRVFASNDSLNLTGSKKAEILVKEFGPQGFDYIGDSVADLRVWRVARGCIVVDPSRLLLRRLKSVNRNISVLKTKDSFFQNFFKLIRVHQWAKNLLVFVPVLCSHRIFDSGVLKLSLLGFFSFSAVASAGYIINDLLDLKADRLHKTKRNRVIASGQVSVFFAIVIFNLALILGFAAAAELSNGFLVVVLSYLFATLSYSFYLKAVVALDVIVLSILYTARIIAGHFAAGIEFSNWLLGFSVFVFLSLALLKRYSELFDLQLENKGNVEGRGYLTVDSPVILSLGTASGYISALILILYIRSDDVLVLYPSPTVLWGIIPVIIFWISRVWILASRGRVHQDPILFAIKDHVSYLVGILVVALAVLAKTGFPL